MKNQKSLQLRQVSLGSPEVLPRIQPFALSEALRRFNLPEGHRDKISKNALKRSKEAFKKDLKKALNQAALSSVSVRQSVITDPKRLLDPRVETVTIH